jgi:hypothetical protein
MNVDLRTAHDGSEWEKTSAKQQEGKAWAIKAQ